MSKEHQALLPGFGRPLNYIPDETDPDYVGRLFKTALSTEELESERLGVAYVVHHVTGNEIVLISRLY